jgi:phage terminase Nu1 subunit (DNA packaging protein)
VSDRAGITTTNKGGLALTVLSFGFFFAEKGLEARGVELTPAQGNILLVLAAISFVAGIGLFLWSFVGRLWSGIKRRWPFALARTVRQLRTRLHDAEQEHRRLRDRNEQLDQLNKNLEAERDQLSEVLLDTKRERAKFRAERDELKAGERRKRIEEWRSVIRDFDFRTYSFAEAEADTFSQMKLVGLRPEVIKMFEAPRTLPVGNEARGDTAYRYTLLDEVARIEREWGLI